MLPAWALRYQLTPNTVLRAGAGVFYGASVATNFQYAGPSFSKFDPIRFTPDNFVTQYATLANPFPAGVAPPQGRTYGKLANWGFSNDSDLDTGVARGGEIYQWNLGVQHLFPGQIVIAADYSANRSTHLPWAGASVSTRERNFLPSSIRDSLVNTMNPTHDPGSSAVGDYLGTLVDNPFQCFFTTVASPASYCPAAPIFNAADVVDSQYVNDQIPQANLLRPYPQFDGGFCRPAPIHRHLLVQLAADSLPEARQPLHQLRRQLHACPKRRMTPRQDAMRGLATCNTTIHNFSTI